MTRAENRKRLETDTFDLVIVGGGINGAGIARDAVLRGYSVALLEQDDFAFGTSSRSSKLVHGGLRYLEKGEVQLVFESVSERHTLSKVARHLVRPLPFVFPSYDYYGAKRSRLALTIALWTYDTLALFRNYKMHKSLSARRVLKLAPGLTAEGLKGGVHYYDYQTNDARLVIENVLAAQGDGACALNYARVEGFDLGGTKGQVVTVRDRERGDTFEVKGRAIVSAAGPWTDELTSKTGDKRRWLSPTKGVHLVFPRERLPVERALALFHPKDGRVHFVIPFFERTLVGTTDTFYDKDPGDVWASADDVAYLLESVNHHFQAAHLVADDVIATWAGLRPLVNEGGDSDDGPSEVSREHHIEVWKEGVVVIAGGKLTTYRLMSRECVDVAAKVIEAAGGPAAKDAVDTAKLPLPGAAGLARDRDLRKLVDELQLRFEHHDIAEHLAMSYGVRAREIATLAKTDPALEERLAEDLPFVYAEVDFVTRHETVVRLRDVMVRRLDLLYRDRDQGLRCCERVAERMAAILDWDAEETAAQVAEYRDVVRGNRAWRESFGRATAAEETESATAP